METSVLDIASHAQLALDRSGNDESRLSESSSDQAQSAHNSAHADLHSGEGSVGSLGRRRRGGRRRVGGARGAGGGGVADQRSAWTLFYTSQPCPLETASKVHEPEFPSPDGPVIQYTHPSTGFPLSLHAVFSPSTNLASPSLSSGSMAPGTFSAMQSWHLTMLSIWSL